MTSDIKPLDSFLSFAPPLMGEEEIAEVSETLRSGWLTTGPRTERFEKELAALVGAGQALAVNSCTAALHLGLQVLGLGPGHGVVTTPLTFASTAHVIMYQRARPFFADIDPATGNLSPRAVRRFLEEECLRGGDGLTRHRVTGDIVKAILPVHYGGHPADLAELWETALEWGLDMLEDAAHAIGAAYRGRPLGHSGLKPAAAGHLMSLTAFSFYATKNLATGEGGLLTGPEGDLMERARVLSMYGISDSRRIWGRYAPKGSWVYDVAELGFKYNMMDIQAALGLRQLEKLPRFIAARAAHAALYQRAFAGLEDLVRRPETKAGVDHAWHLYPLRLKPEALTIGRDEFIEELRAHNIGASVLFIPLHYHSFYRAALGYAEGSFPEAENFFKNLVNLPVAPAHSPERVGQAAEIAARLLKKHRR
ncbi:MAG: DegT/DnrJ/EryC1/StrS aminotransferase family protein [Candidatus Adiutrix sp.]|jgi:dTDP-4-amino-4,6-dideoxygalactose transaminase|nr:DegT/DnrJ/EryC1/StrS aminotransferase family protein [Candidatus Adiutrix sp.]